MAEWKYICEHEYIVLTQDCGTLPADGCLKKKKTRVRVFCSKGHFRLMRVTDKTSDRGQKAERALAQRREDSGSGS